jgi:hypothetical protein
MGNITQVQDTLLIRDAEFVRVTLPSGTTYCFSSSFRNETFDGSTFSGSYTALGGLVSVSGQQRDLAVTSYDTSISLVGVNKTQLGSIITAPLKGSKVEIWRVFYNDNYEIDGSPVKRYTGVINNYVLDENFADRDDTFALSLHCASFKRMLETRLAGRFTNESSWKAYDPNDTAMDNVAAINLARYNFGQKLA